MLLERGATRRVAVMGVGNELQGDDAAGVLVARALRPVAHERLLVIDAGLAPENYTGPLRRFNPDLVLLVDAAHLGEPAGSVRWLSWQQVDGLTASTHTTPPSMLSQFLAETLGCEVVLVGIQPQEVRFDAPLSPAVAAAIEAVTEGVSALFGADNAYYAVTGVEVVSDGPN